MNAECCPLILKKALEILHVVVSGHLQSQGDPWVVLMEALINCYHEEVERA